MARRIHRYQSKSQSPKFGFRQCLCQYIRSHVERCAILKGYYPALDNFPRVVILHLDVFRTFSAVHSSSHARLIVLEHSRASQPYFYLGEDTPRSNDGLGALSQGQVLGLGQRLRNSSLLLRPPGDHRAIEHEYESGRRAAVRAISSPVRVVVRVHLHLHLLRLVLVYAVN